MKQLISKQSRLPLGSLDTASCSEVRCKCHRLLARYRNGKVVLRCPRCKKQAVFSIVNACVPDEINVEFVPHITT